MKTQIIALLVCSFGIAAAAQAGGVEAIKYDDLRAHCANVGKEKGGSPGTQLPVKNPMVSCRDVVTSWEYGDPGQLSFDTKRVVDSALTDKFFYVPQGQDAVPAADKSFSCPVYEEVVTTYNTELAISCDQVNTYATLTDFCVASIDAKGKVGSTEGKTGAEKVKTGRSVTLCQAGKGKTDGGKKN
jgi:hypothetical protein